MQNKKEVVIPTRFERVTPRLGNLIQLFNFFKFIYINQDAIQYSNNVILA